MDIQIGRYIEANRRLFRLAGAQVYSVYMHAYIYISLYVYTDI